MVRRFKRDEICAMAEILRHDGVLSVPTDTVYGVCARYNSLAAQEHLRDIKKRPQDKAFPLMCADIEQIRSIAVMDEISEALAAKLMPGPVTLILQKKEHVPSFVNGGMDTLAIRMATDETLAKLIKATGCPLYMTSANLSGAPVCTNLDEIENSCPDLDGIMEGEPSFGEASTIIDCTKQPPVIVRKGPVSEETVNETVTAVKGK